MLKISNKEYHNRPEISKSDLDLLAKSPYHFKHKELFKSDSPSLTLGSAVHKLVLEPDEFYDEFDIIPDIDRRTKQGRANYDEFIEKLGDKTPLDKEIFLKAEQIAKSVLDMKQTAIFLKNGFAERSFFGSINGIGVRCRPDFYNEALGLVVDLKTTQDASALGFAKSVANFNYHIQAAFYTDILMQNNIVVNNFLFIAVESKAPYMVGFYELDEVALELGRQSYEKLLNRYKVALECDEWWGYADFDGKETKAVQTISLPNWKYYESERI